MFFLPPVNKQAVPNLIQHFDCSYMTGMPSPLYRFGLCLNKMYDSMMAGVPIICAFDSPKTLVSQYKCGIECDPSDDENVISAIRKIQQMTIQERHQMGKNGQKAVLANFTNHTLAKKFLDSIDEVRSNMK